MTREQSLSVVQSEGLDIPSRDDLSSTTTRTILGSISNFNASKRCRIAVKLAVRLWLDSLALSGSYYADFENALWTLFSQDVDPESQLCTITNAATIGLEVKSLYSKHLCGMFAASKKTRHDFYQQMLTEAGLRMDLYEAQFGEIVVQFYRMACRSAHLEHLLAFYWAGLLIRAYMAINRKYRLPLADKEPEDMYKHFEGWMPLSDKFTKYTTEDAFFNSQIKMGLYPRVNQL